MLTLTTYSYDTGNQLNLAMQGSSPTTYTNDAAGNRTAILPSSGQNVYYGWDAYNRMITAQPAAGVISYTYDGEDRRVGENPPAGLSTQFVYDFERLLQESDASDTTDYLSTAEQYGHLLGTADSGGAYFLSSNAMGSTEILMDSLGEAASYYTYSSAFGLPPTTTTPTADIDYTWVARKSYRLETQTNLYLLSRRYYDPATVRFLSTDPKGEVAGDLNLYRYCFNDPVNMSDPSGYYTIKGMLTYLAKKKEYYDILHAMLDTGWFLAISKYKEGWATSGVSWPEIFENYKNRDVKGVYFQEISVDTSERRASKISEETKDSGEKTREVHGNGYIVDFVRHLIYIDAWQDDNAADYMIHAINAIMEKEETERKAAEIDAVPIEERTKGQTAGEIEAYFDATKTVGQQFANDLKPILVELGHQVATDALEFAAGQFISKYGVSALSYLLKRGYRITKDAARGVIRVMRPAREVAILNRAKKIVKPRAAIPKPEVVPPPAPKGEAFNKRTRLRWRVHRHC